MNFANAIEALQHGKKVRRKAWFNDRLAYLKMYQPGEFSSFSKFYIVFDGAGKLEPWSANQVDEIAYDWEIID